MSDDVIAHMRARIEQCRRLAKYINDPRTTEALLKMAEDGEADSERLQAGKASPQTSA
jgi:hypothetical protein